jgi:hypothetical protein
MDNTAIPDTHPMPGSVPSTIQLPPSFGGLIAGDAGVAMRAAAAEALMAGSLLVGSLTLGEMKDRYKDRPDTTRLAAALEKLRESLSE